MLARAAVSKRNMMLVLTVLLVMVVSIGLVKYGASLGNANSGPSVLATNVTTFSGNASAGTNPVRVHENNSSSLKSAPYGPDNDNYSRNSLHDDFGGPAYILHPLQLSPNGEWFGLWNGGGSFGTVHDSKSDTNVFFLAPKTASQRNETHSALVVSSKEFKNFHLSADIRIDKQVRTNISANPWEGGWIMWRWNDPTHHYYIALKTSGQEIGKYDGGTNPQSQIILKTTRTPPAEVGEWDHLDLTVNGSHIVAVIDGIKTFDFNDKSSFDAGKIAMYCEDARVSFDNIRVEAIN